MTIASVAGNRLEQRAVYSIILTVNGNSFVYGKSLGQIGISLELENVILACFGNSIVKATIIQCP